MAKVKIALKLFLKLILFLFSILVFYFIYFHISMLFDEKILKKDVKLFVKKNAIPLKNINNYLNLNYPILNKSRDSSFVHFISKEEYLDISRYRDLENSNFKYDSLLELKMDEIKCNEVSYYRNDSTLGLRLYGKFKFGDRFRIGIYKGYHIDSTDYVGEGYYVLLSRWEGI